MSDKLDDQQPQNSDVVIEAADSENDGVIAERQKNTNDYFRAMMDKNFLEYASYVIGSRAIPDVDDGLKPVQRRIMWTLYQIYENGRPTKTANVIGNAMTGSAVLFIRFLYSVWIALPI